MKICKQCFGEFHGKQCNECASVERVDKRLKEARDEVEKEIVIRGKWEQNISKNEVWISVKSPYKAYK